MKDSLVQSIKHMRAHAKSSLRQLGKAAGASKSSKRAQPARFEQAARDNLD
jgi:hypothetical protein